MQQRFSVVIPLYNKSRCIQRTLESVFAQSYQPHEVIVVDDGSQDGGDRLVAGLGHPLVRILRQANAGVACARNRGMAVASGDWIAFLDADDLWHPHHLASLASLIADDSDAMILANRYISIKEADIDSIVMWESVRIERKELINDLPARWMQGATFFTSSVAVHKELLNRLDTWFPPGESNGEDLDLWFRAAEISPIALGPQALVARVWTPDGLSVTHASTELPEFARRMELRARAKKTPKAVRASAISFVNHLRITNARVLVAQGRRREALRALLVMRGGYGSLRWWITLTMAALVPSSAVIRWQTWRKRRKMIIG